MFSTLGIRYSNIPSVSIAVKLLFHLFDFIFQSGDDECGIQVGAELYLVANLLFRRLLVLTIENDS